MPFFGIQILQNSISTGAVPRNPLGELTTLHSCRLGRGSIPSTPLASRSRRFGAEAWCLWLQETDTGVWRWPHKPNFWIRPWT